MNYLKYIGLFLAGSALGWFVGYMIAKKAADKKYLAELAAQKAKYESYLNGASSPVRTGTTTTTTPSQTPSTYDTAQQIAPDRY